MFKNIVNKLRSIRLNDPVYSCDLYLEEGCSHVDGMLCDFPECDMYLDYIQPEVRGKICIQPMI